MNEKIAVLSKRPSNINISSSVPDVFTEAFKNEPDYVLDPTIPVRARSFEIEVSHPADLEQYKRTVRAYKTAKVMYFKDIANAGKYLGHRVEAKEDIDAFVKPGWEAGNEDEPIEEENRITAWQDTGESISVRYHLPSPITGTELAQHPQSSTSGEQKIPVLEGISVYNQFQTTENPVSQHDADLEGNRFLQPLKKAA